MMEESGLLVFKLIEGKLARSDVRVEVVMDDHIFPSYSSSKARSRQTQFGESESCLGPRGYSIFIFCV